MGSGRKTHHTSNGWQILLLTFSLGVIMGAVVPTTIDDFFLPGSQPLESGNLESPGKCDNCHGGYDINVEPSFSWKGGMMSQAARDPLYEACLTIANQDVPFSGDLCIRCHSPEGWLSGRSTPTDGSALTPADREGVHCDFCHRLVKPAELGVNPFPDDPDYTSNTYPGDQQYLQSITAIPPMSGTGMYIVDSDNSKRGPFTDAGAKHQFTYSPFHQESALCGTCHDVSNPVYHRNPDNTYTANDFGMPSGTFDNYELFPIERTYSEWLMSAYNSESGIYAPQFGGNKSYVSTCQDCHMKDVSGVAANKTTAVNRNDLPFHDLTGGNTFIPGLIKQIFPGDVDPVALDSGMSRAGNMLRKAAALNVTVQDNGDSFSAIVRVTNETGHKLPSGYPEGRRIWINLIARDSNGSVLYESGNYNPATGVLTQDQNVKIYEIKPGLDTDVAALAGLDPGPSFHFAMNNKIYSDNRIPPRGFTNSNFEYIQSAPVGYSYLDGQYWDDTQYTLPINTESVEVTLFYQTLSKEYIEFLRDENITNNAGQSMYNLWNTNGKSPPVVMNSMIMNISHDSDNDGIPDYSDNCIHVSNSNQTDADNDHYGAACDCDDNDPAVNLEKSWWADSDSDGYGDPDTSQQSCTQPAGYVDNDLDCDDSDPAVNPEKLWWADSDSDGYGNPDTSQQSCTQPGGYVDNDLDCDDTDISLTLGSNWYADADGDSYGDPISITYTCNMPVGYVDNDLDCDDTNDHIYPGADPLPDGKDNDCDGIIDKAPQTLTFNPVGDIPEDVGETELIAFSSSGLPVYFTVEGGNVEISDNILIILGAGEVQITAHQDGNTIYLPAETITQVICVIPVKPVITQFVEDGQTILTSSADTGNHWYLDNVPIQGTNDPSIHADKQGTYTVQVVIDQCAGEISDPVEVVITGFENPSSSGFMIYPNPNTGWMIIRLPDELINSNLNIGILDDKGEYILRSIRKKGGPAEMTFDLGNYPSGQYYYMIENRDSGELFRGKFILY